MLRAISRHSLFIIRRGGYRPGSLGDGHYSNVGPRACANGRIIQSHQLSGIHNGATFTVNRVSSYKAIKTCNANIEERGLVLVQA